MHALFEILNLSGLVAIGVIAFASWRIWRAGRTTDSCMMAVGSFVLLVAAVYQHIADYIRTAPHIGRPGGFSVQLNWFDVALIYVTPLALLVFGTGFLLFAGACSNNRQPNKSPEPTPGSVTRAASAPGAPPPSAAQL